MSSLKKFSARAVAVVALIALSASMAATPAAAAVTTTTVNGVIYTMDGAGAAYASGTTADLPANLTIESSVTIGITPLAVTAIGQYAFLDNIILKSVVIPDSVTSIGAFSFKNNTSLESLVIGNSVVSIGDYAFVNHAKLKSIVIPDSVTSIGKAAFADNFFTSLLESVVIGSSVVSIGEYAFYGNTRLLSVVIPDSVTSIGSRAFQYNSSLASLVIGKSVVSIGSIAFTGCSKLVSVVIPDSVTSIGDSAFSGNSLLESLVIGKSVVSIGASAFYENKKLKSVVIPDSVTSIGASAFWRNDSLVSITFLGAAPSAGSNAFLGAYQAPKAYYYKRFGSGVVAGGFTSPTWQGVIAVAVDDPLTLTPTPTISGTPQFGETLTAVSGDWDLGVALSYQWKRNGTAITGATSATYTPVQADLGAVITVTVTGSMVGFTTASKTSLPTTAIAAGTQTATPTPTISGTATVGQTLTATAGSWDVGVALTYQWLRDDVAILGASSATYVLTGSDLATLITVSVTGTKSGYTTVTQTSLPTAAVLVGAINSTPTPTISGTATVGQTLTAVSGSWDAGVAFTYVWKRDGVSISLATGSTYLLTAADLGAAITVEVTGSKTYFASVAKTSAATAAVAPGTLTLTPTPTITGSATVGQTLTAVAGSWDLGVTFGYVWKRNGVAITGATASTYTLVAADLGKTITVTVTGSKAGVPSVAKTSLPTSTVIALKNLQSASKPSIAGELAFGKTLTANLGQWDSGVSFTYQWNRNGVAIAGATSIAYVLTVADLGQAISFTVIGTKAGFVTTTKTSSNSSAVRGATFGNARSPIISGKTRVGQVLTANTSGWDSGVSFTYQWKRWGTAIAGATSVTYTTVFADRGAAISVTVVGTKLGFATATRTSDASTAIEWR